MRDAKRITIVGGGTSAWMTAALLLNNITKDTTISLIDKTDGGNPVGVGEATILSFKAFMDDCGFPLREWFSEVTATFKGGILFENWKGEGEDILARQEWPLAPVASQASDRCPDFSIAAAEQSLHFYVCSQIP